MITIGTILMSCVKWYSFFVDCIIKFVYLIRLDSVTKKICTYNNFAQKVSQDHYYIKLFFE